MPPFPRSIPMRIFTSTAVSLDGRISILRNAHVQLGSDEDRRRMSELRALSDAILVGGNSFRNWPYPALPRLEHCRRDLNLSPVWNVIVSRRMDFALPDRFLCEKKVRPLFLTSSPVPDGFPAEVSTAAEVS